jgi:hypothetical protein
MWLQVYNLSLGYFRYRIHSDKLIPSRNITIEFKTIERSICRMLILTKLKLN